MPSKLLSFTITKIGAECKAEGSLKTASPRKGNCWRNTELCKEEEDVVKLEKILSHGEGVWFSDFWMKFLSVFLLVNTVVIALLAYWK